jgi:hypothetical protein
MLVRLSVKGDIVQEIDPLSAIEQIVEAARGGRWLLVAAGALILVMFGLRKARDHFKWFKGDRGGALLVILLSLAGALSTALATSASVDWKLFVGALAVAFTASGGYNNIRRIIWPQDGASTGTAGNSERHDTQP